MPKNKYYDYNTSGKLINTTLQSQPILNPPHLHDREVIPLGEKRCSTKTSQKEMLKLMGEINGHCFISIEEWFPSHQGISV